MMIPTKKVINETMGIAPTPASVASWIARCSMRLRFRGDRNSNRSDLAQISASPPT